MNILTINAGSSTIKFKVFRYHNKNKVNTLLSGQVSQLKAEVSLLYIKTQASEFTEKLRLNRDDIYLNAIRHLCQSPKFSQFSLDCVINRFVHGGDEYKEIVLLHEKTMQALSKYNDFAPHQQPYNILIARHFMQLYPDIKHYGCFDTGFHQTIPVVSRVYPLPWKYAVDGVKGYGYHGLSYAYIARQLHSLVDSKQAKGRWIIAHLGGCSSLCGIKNGKSLVSSLGFSAADGVPMASYCGEIDPALLLHLRDKYKLTEDDLRRILTKESGLLGLSDGISGDIEELLASLDEQAKVAVMYYVTMVACSIVKLATQLGGLQGIIFTGGIGQNNAEVRALILEQLEWLGVEFNKKANNNNKLKIGKKESDIKVLVLPTDEEYFMVNELIEHKL